MSIVKPYVCRCSDYVIIDRGIAGTTEICGNSPSSDSRIQLNNFTVTFRSDKERTYTGFEMYVTCFWPEEANKEGI